MTTTTSPAKIGDIFEESWGYDETNVDFYEVVGTTATMVKLRRIASTVTDGSSVGSHRVVAVPGAFLDDKVISRKVLAGGGVKVRSWGSYAYPWDGKPCYETSAGFGH